MSPLFWSTYVLLWLLTLVLTLMVVLLYRQFGLMWMGSRRSIDLGGIEVGKKAPIFEVPTPEGVITFDWAARETEGDFRGFFALFGLPSCPICLRLIETTAVLPQEWPGIEFIWIEGRTPEGEIDEFRERMPVGWSSFIASDESAHAAMDVPAVPYSYLISANGNVIAKGLVNSLEDIETMLTSTLHDDGLRADSATCPDYSGCGPSRCCSSAGTGPCDCYKSVNTCLNGTANCHGMAGTWNGASCWTCDSTHYFGCNGCTCHWITTCCDCATSGCGDSSGRCIIYYRTIEKLCGAPGSRRATREIIEIDAD